MFPFTVMVSQNMRASKEKKNKKKNGLVTNGSVQFKNSIKYIRIHEGNDSDFYDILQTPQCMMCICANTE